VIDRIEEVSTLVPARSETRSDRGARVEAEFRAFVGDPRFSCLAGKGVVRGGGCEIAVYGRLGSARSARLLARDLAAFVETTPADGSGLHAFAAVFPTGAPESEEEFERRLWNQIQLLHERDAPDAGWDPHVSADPADSHFSFSFAGRAMFVVGLHPASSRLARRFRWPALVFNPRAQFERLRAEGRFERLRETVREREIALQGTLNPNLADFGESSEARQYAGRAVEADWRCPFHRKEP
jgi:FPC/CPF motif-containing protein YcgG